MRKEENRTFQLLDRKTLDLIGCISKDELKLDWKFTTHAQLLKYLDNGKLYQNRYVVIEDEKHLYKEWSGEESALLKETRDHLLYVTNKGVVYAKNKLTKDKRIVSTKRRKSKNYITFEFGKNSKEWCLKTEVWNHFGDEPYNYSKHVILHKDNDIENCTIDNLYLYPRGLYMKHLSSKGRKDKKCVGLFENNKLVKKFDSISDAAKENFVTKQCVSRICNGKVNKGIFDFRFI